MSEAGDINALLSHVRKLNKENKLFLLKRIMSPVRVTQCKDVSVKVSSFSGIGRYIWSDLDIDEYISGERDW